jgi:prevent-host-death family protein
MDTTVSIVQLKRDISELINRVAYRGEHIVLTSRGKPKAVLIGLEEYQRFKETERRTTGWAN